MSAELPTPLTDAAAYDWTGQKLIDHGRHLERRLAASEARVKELEEELSERGKEYEEHAQQLYDSNSAKKERIQELEAQCAVMREALEPIYEAIKVPNYERTGRDRNEEYAQIVGKMGAKIRKALSTDCDKTLLSDLAKMKTALQEIANHCYTTQDCDRCRVLAQEALATKP